MWGRKAESVQLHSYRPVQSYVRNAHFDAKIRDIFERSDAGHLQKSIYD